MSTQMISAGKPWRAFLLQDFLLVQSNLSAQNVLKCLFHLVKIKKLFSYNSFYDAYKFQ